MGLTGFSCCPSLLKTQMKGKVGVAVLLLATKVAADTVLLVGGEVDNYLHPAIALRLLVLAGSFLAEFLIFPRQGEMEQQQFGGMSWWSVVGTHSLEQSRLVLL